MRRGTITWFVPGERMLSYTIKAVLDTVRKYCGNKSYSLWFETPDRNTLMKFSINKDECSVIHCERESTKDSADKLIGDHYDMEIKSYVTDFESVILPGEMSVTTFIETSSFGENNSVSVNFDAQLFVRVFKLMRDRVWFSVQIGNEMKDCHYIDRKMYFSETVGNIRRLVQTDLYKFFSEYGAYDIRLFCPLSGKITVDTLRDREMLYAEEKGLTFEYKAHAGGK